MLPYSDNFSYEHTTRTEQMKIPVLVLYRLPDFADTGAPGIYQAGEI
jgi:hypothetical protein